MHEFSLVKKEVDRLKNKINGKKVKKIVFSLGRLSHGTPESINQAFKTATANTSLSKAEIEIVSIEPKIRCLSCGKVFQVTGDLKLNCIKCGSFSSELIEGEECYISSIEAED
jgi:hydrogenase nickel incorporation protein HypA/HybF